MFSVGLVSFCCIMFIHLGLGETICRIIHYDLIFFRCQKCLNFWAVLVYALFFKRFGALESLSIAFCMSYTALWIDLILSKIAQKYDYWYEENEEMGDEPEEVKSNGNERAENVHNGPDRKK